MIGRFVFSKSGHDKGKCYVVIDCDQKRFALCDGNSKTIPIPKWKNPRHLQMTNDSVTPNMKERLLRKESVTNEEVKYVIKCYRSHLHEKSEGNDVKK
jgi:ribosomal protein L14E/L6E/L27E